VIRVWIETSSPVARAGLQALLEDGDGIEIVSRIGDADVILRDSVAEFRAVGGDVPVVLLSDEPLTPRIFGQGVRAVVPNHAEPAQIVAAVGAAAAGLVAVTLDAAPMVTSPEVFEFDAEPLTPRESEVLEMLAEGLSNKEIAARLSISEHTAKFHVNSILGKLDAGTRTEAVTKGIRTGILKI
jgi:DNA-binding NarL/FixJ family response regulator